MPISTQLSKRLGLRHPIIQAPMGGGATSIELVSRVSETGALGFLGCAYNTPEQIAELSGGVRSRTSEPFGINLFAPLPTPPLPSDTQTALDRLTPFHRELGLPAPTPPAAPTVTFEAQLEAALSSGASVFSFTFGIPPQSAIAAAKAQGMFVVGTATTVVEAIAVEAAGMDAVVAQGSEAGAHRGTFEGDFGAAMVGTIALVPQMVDAVGIPVIASGGIMDGRGIAAALALGAQAVQMGTAFLTCDEAGIPDVHKAAILAAEEQQTTITRAFSGRPARGIVNRFVREVEDPTAPPAVLPYPLQNALTRPLRTAAGKAGKPEFLSLWAGQGVRMARRQSASDLIDRLAEETDRVRDSLAALDA